MGVEEATLKLSPADIIFFSSIPNMSSKKMGLVLKKYLTQKKSFKKAIMLNDWTRKAPKSPSHQVGVYAILIFFIIYSLATCASKTMGLQINDQS